MMPVMYSYFCKTIIHINTDELLFLGAPQQQTNKRGRPSRLGGGGGGNKKTIDYGFIDAPPNNASAVNAGASPASVVSIGQQQQQQQVVKHNRGRSSSNSSKQENQMRIGKIG